MNEYNNYCIVCNKYSNGKPQCKSCWQESQNFYAELEKTPKYTKYWNSLNSLLKTTILTAQKEPNNDNKQKFCNKLIAIGFLANDYFIDGDETLDDIYDEVKNLNTDFIYNNTYEVQTLDIETNDFRKQNPANIYCQDGHYVRSKEERAIDDYLYKDAQLLHAYEPKFRLTPSEQKICLQAGKEFEFFYPDFYTPKYNLYIEFFGKNDEQYNLKTDLKIKIYTERKDINFNYLTYKDSNILLEKLEDILEFYKHKYK